MFYGKSTNQAPPRALSPIDKHLVDYH
jgi:hypothetical protein